MAGQRRSRLLRKAQRITRSPVEKEFLAEVATVRAQRDHNLSELGKEYSAKRRELDEEYSAKRSVIRNHFEKKVAELTVAFGKKEAAALKKAGVA